MREDVANLVYPVFTHGIRLKERLAGDDAPEFATARKELQGLLQTASQAQRVLEHGNEPSRGDGNAPGGADVYLGIHYALVCWLDEIFILDSSWKEQWSEQSLEVDLYKTRERAWKFWEQADLAGARPTTDALEVFYLCVMLGFRGERADRLDDLKNWCERVKAQIEHGNEATFQLPVEGQPLTYVPFLRGAKRQQSMLAVAAVAAFVLIPAFMFILVLILGRR